MKRYALALLLATCTLSGAQGQGVAWPGSLAQVDSGDGVVLLNEAQAVPRQSFLAEGQVLTTGSNGFATLVFSNGLVISCGPSSRLRVEKARQLELTDVYAAGEYETSSSDFVIQLEQGSFGFFQPEPELTSRLELRTRYGGIEGDAARFAIVLDGTEPMAAALNGNLYYWPEGGTRRFIAEGEALNLREASLDNAHTALSKLMASGSLRFQPLIAPARKTAERTVFLAENGQPVFRTVIRPVAVQGTAYNDYRLSE